MRERTALGRRARLLHGFSSHAHAPGMSRAPLSIALRSVTALIGGYLASAALATLLARLLPIARAEATGWGMILSFLIYAAIGLWAFRERRLMVVALTIWGIAAAAIGLLVLLGVRP